MSNGKVARVGGYQDEGCACHVLVPLSLHSTEANGFRS